MISKILLYQNSKISYKILGKGDPVIMIHGFGFNHKIWYKIAESLKSEFMFILPDLPGSGDSEKLDKRNVSLSDFAMVINDIISHEKIEEPVIIGHSMGGYVTMAFEKLFPGISKALCLFHSSSYADDEEKIAARKKGITFIQKFGSETFLNNSIPGLFYDKIKSAEDINKYLEEAKKISPEIIISYYEAMISRDDNRDILKNYEKPILFLIGEFDTAIPFKTSLEQTYINNDSDVTILRKSAHMGMLEESEKSSRTIHNFLEKVSVK